MLNSHEGLPKEEGEVRDKRIRLVFSCLVLSETVFRVTVRAGPPKYLHSHFLLFVVILDLPSAEQPLHFEE